MVMVILAWIIFLSIISLIAFLLFEPDDLLNFIQSVVTLLVMLFAVGFVCYLLDWSFKTILKG